MAELVRPDWRLLVNFLGYNGLRWGEVASLRVSRVDLDRRRIVVVESVSPVRTPWCGGSTKGHERRDVALPRFLVPDWRR